MVGHHICGLMVQVLLLMIITVCTNWDSEVHIFCLPPFIDSLIKELVLQIAHLDTTTPRSYITTTIYNLVYNSNASKWKFGFTFYTII